MYRLYVSSKITLISSFVFTLVTNIYFSQFKTNCFEEFNIFPDIFWTLPRFSYQAWLLGMIETPLEFVKDKGTIFLILTQGFYVYFD